MKSYSNRVALLWAAVVLFLGASVPSWANDRPVMKNGPILTAKEAKALSITAKTSKDHRNLAAYYLRQAGRFEADAKDHAEMIEAYRKSPTPWAIKTPGGVRTIEHCEFLAKSDREMAKALQEMAAAHEQMASEASKK